MRQAFSKFSIQTVIVQILFAVISVLLGHIYTIMRLMKDISLITHSTILLCVAAVVVTVADCALRWANFVYEEGKIKTPFFACPIGGAVLFYLAFAREQTTNREWVFGVCVIHMLLLMLINWFFIKSGIGSDNKKSGRFYVIIPLMTVVVHHTLLGCCLTMANYGAWVCMPLMLISALYFLVFFLVCKMSVWAVSAVNCAFLLPIIVLVGLHFLDFYATTPSPWLMHPYATMFIKALGLSVYCGVVIYIPGMVSLTYIYAPQATDPHHKLYSDILTWLGAVGLFVTYLTWLWVEYSTLYLIGMAVASALWVISAVFHKKRVSMAVSLIGSITIGVILCTEFLGMWSGHTLHMTVNEDSLLIKAVGEVIVFIGAGIYKAIRNWGKGIHVYIGTLGKYMIIHLLTFFVMFLFIFFGADPKRVSFAEGVLLCEMIGEIACWVIVLWILKYVDNEKQEKLPGV